MRKIFILLFSVLLPLSLMAQGSGGEIRRQEQQQSQPVNSQTLSRPQNQRAETINYDTYNSALVLKAQSGDAQAQYCLGMVYENGWGIKEDLIAAIELYKLSSEQGNGNAMYQLGLCYEKGKGVDKNEDLALELYIKAAELNVAGAKTRSDAIIGERQERERRIQEQERELAEEKERKEQLIQQEKSRKEAIIQNLINNMVKVDGGTFMMGATEEQKKDAIYDEKPIHQVTLSSYYIGKYEVTQEEWEVVMGNNPSSMKGAKWPVECVTWLDCFSFIQRLNQLTGKTFRLPTEAEWEFAARGGNLSKGYKYSGSDEINDVGWYEGNSDGKTHHVGFKRPNELGLYDMSGNVSEWCEDWYSEKYYKKSEANNPKGPSSSPDSVRVARGGSIESCVDNKLCIGGVRVSSRMSWMTITKASPLFGLRLAL